ncbi:MarR family winged helix-turn-helix transcriptional regulator [Noviherbaspirillum saxi]|uniref:MarR family transcriptional regulator n=1 Tax=Noviherbaspirillum saxi TaxID=2320863 RepID=A0A3A3FGH4_9BURK|nr:MarR family transcriptional regulator [Noviherbaspirillum saxi]RJF92280.1 MarR family transcriptional regulator [Noviherbaspirillum saxi]
MKTSSNDHNKQTLSEDLYAQPGHLLRRAQQISASLFFDEIDADITPIQYAVLHTLMEHPGIDQVSVAGLVAIDTSTAATVIVRLEQRGLLTREVHAVDRRLRVVNLTKAGEKLLVSLIPAIHRLHQKILEPFTVTEAQQFMKLLHKLVHLQNEQSRAPFSEMKRDLPVDRTPRKRGARS